MSGPFLFLRPCARPFVQRSQAASSSYLGFYTATKAPIRPQTPRSLSEFNIRSIPSSEKPADGPRIRATRTEDEVPDLWPRLPEQKDVLDCRTFRAKYHAIPAGAILRDEQVAIHGRIWSIRVAGSKLAFFDICQDNTIVQCVLNKANFEQDATGYETRRFLQGLRRGDVVTIRGYPHRTSRRELSVMASEIPQLLSRCLEQLPDDIQNVETKMRNRHVDLLISPLSRDRIRLRSEILKSLRQYLSSEDYVEVHTPILAGDAGGATARPFQTTATEFQDQKLSLRIAPELWLKRLIIGGFDKVFEIGPCIDLTHNPEFWTCEFYKTYTRLEELIGITEKMFSQITIQMSKIIRVIPFSEMPGSPVELSPPFPRLDFLPAIEAALGRKLPDLSSPDVTLQLISIFNEKNIPPPSVETVPRLLDKLSSEYLEPQCVIPTWIINHPECLSPLSKSFIHPDNGQRVAARAELFVKQLEIVNTYEEENSPFEQRRKFETQLSYRDPENPAEGVDESYIQALEWGMPPTGGWGCGIDRLCMLFGRIDRIADTLSFGTLRNVVGLGRIQTKSSAVSDEKESLH